MTTSMARTTASFLLRLAGAAAIVFFALLSRAGGPRYIAGTTYFNPGTAGQPLVWAQGQVLYFTDQGDLSPILPNASANTLVANAFSQWTSVATAAVTSSSGGDLAEDVNGSNVYLNSDGSISMPADIQPSATSTPVGIVYDDDGSVTSALLGAGAGSSSQCFFNAVFGGVDNFSTSGTFEHALVVINGQCAQQPAQLNDVEYRLVRTLGNVLGLGWSQLNLNVITGSPPATSDDYAGFPVMHFLDPFNCVPITRCYSSPYTLAMDDAASLSRLYPVTAANQPVAGKQVFSATTGRIHGSVWFTDSSGRPTQPMQGVNVVARWIDPSTGKASRRYAASSVSGFRFTGDAGNPVTGFTDALGNLYSKFGSSDSAWEGFFDLAGLQIPTGTSALYQLTVESLDGKWSEGVGPYGPFQVTPSGAPQPIVVTVAAGLDVEHDILMSASARPMPQWAASETWHAPAPVPAAGDWVGSLSNYGEVAYFSLPAQANRTLSVAVTALDEHTQPTESKTQPVIGMWAIADPQGTPPPVLTPSAFNSASFGMTRLDTRVLTSGSYLIGISDLRGDGRPDYAYHAHVLYADSVFPSRLSVNGGTVTLRGIGFAPGLAVTAGTAAAPLAISAGQMMVEVPAQNDGVQNLTITDAVSGASSTITNAITLGAAPTDNIVLLQGLNSSTPVGTQAARPVSVRVLASDSVTVVNGATVAWSATNGVTLTACGGASSCSALTDESGTASTWVTPAAAGTATITATLAPASYSSPKSVLATLTGTSSALDIGVMTEYLWIAQGATLSTPLTARVMSSGAPKSGATVNFAIMQGSGSLSSASAVTSRSGYATVSLSVAQFLSAAQISVCVAPANNPCQTIYVNPVPVSAQNLQPVSGAAQVTAFGNPFQPIAVRVTDSSSPPNLVLGATVGFQATVMRPGGAPPSGGSGDTNSGNPAMPVILSVSQTAVQSDANGLATIVPSAGSFTGPLQVDVVVSIGTAAVLNYVLEELPADAAGEGSDANPSPPLQDFLRRRFGE
jgi:IPT/TIG domain-containing protein